MRVLGISGSLRRGLATTRALLRAAAERLPAGVGAGRVRAAGARSRPTTADLETGGRRPARGRASCARRSARPTRS